MARPSTVPMEESLLYHVTHIQSVARMILPRLRESMFTSSERAFICKSAKDVYEKTHGLLSELVFNHELGKLPESERKLASAAYNIVCTRSDPQDCETLISKLAEEELGRTIAEQLSKEKDLLVAGNFKELERTRKVAALSTTGSIDHIRLVDYSDYKRREQTMKVGLETELAGLSADERKILVADESLLNAGSALQLSHPPAPYGVFNIKLMKSGGITGAKEIAVIAKNAGIQLFWGCNDESIVSIAAALHAAYSCPNTKYLDLDGSFDLSKDLVEGGFILKDGYMTTNGLPGLGVKRL